MSAPQHCYLRMHHDSIFHCCGPGLRFKKLPKQIGLDFHVQYLLTESYIGFFVNCSLFNDKYSSYFHMTFYLRKCHFLIFFWLTNKFELVSRPLTVGIYLSVAMNYQELWIKCSVEQFSFCWDNFKHRGEQSCASINLSEKGHWTWPTAYLPALSPYRLQFL